MSLHHIRDILAFPEGANASDTFIGGAHFNLTTLDYWNYTLFSNGTLSNGSKCYMAVEPWTPATLLNNGTFVNTTGCYNPLDGIGTRASIGIAFGVLFAICLVGVLMNLARHGKLHLPAEKRFVPIGRRWQWYWAIFIIVTAFISLFTNIDVDRFRVMGLPIVLNGFFWFLMQMGLIALVWESVRHWGSWQERQYIDPDPFMLPDSDRRSRFEFFLPLTFYLWLWINFFLIVPRNWGRIEEQRSPEQTVARAEPGATDIRFKLAALFLFISWLTIVVSMVHSIKHYKMARAGPSQTLAYLRHVPPRFLLTLTLALAAIAYQALISFEWAYSILNANASYAAVYVGGYGPALLTIIVQITWGFLTPNEDVELKRQRRLRGEHLDRELGHTRKPAWWRRVKDASVAPAMGGGRPTARGVRDNWSDAPRSTVEMADMRGSGAPARRASQVGLIDAAYAGKSDRRRSERAVSAAGDVLFPDAEAQAAAARARAARLAEVTLDGPAPPPYSERPGSVRGRQAPGAAPSDVTAGDVPRPVGSERSTSTGTGVSGRQPQQIRSMLDI